jgi:hypothetical protein
VNGDITKSAALLLCIAVSIPSVAWGRTAAPASCGAALLQALPSRPTSAPIGSEFVRRVWGMSETERDQAIEAELIAGNFPSFLRRLVPVSVRGKLHHGAAASVTVCVMPDYLAIGSDRDFLRMPMRLTTALRVAQRYGFTLPTSKLVDAIYAQAVVRLSPQPLPAGDEMRSTGYYWHHNELIDEQQIALDAPPGVLTAGHKKDLVLTNRLWRNPGRVAIYGWHRAADSPIQPLSTVHGARYADYSHGVRLVSSVAYVDGEPRSLFEVLADPELAPLLSEEGQIPRPAALVASLLAYTAASDGSPETGSSSASAP